jgi:hypothetical protein
MARRNHEIANDFVLGLRLIAGMSLAKSREYRRRDFAAR